MSKHAPNCQCKACELDRAHRVVYNLIWSERESQIFHGYDAAHDAGHEYGEITRAAICYAAVAEQLMQGAEPRSMADLKKLKAYDGRKWPFEHGSWNPNMNPIRNLVKAAALICAEINRLIEAEAWGKSDESLMTGKDKPAAP